MYADSGWKWKDRTICALLFRSSAALEGLTAAVFLCVPNLTRDSPEWNEKEQIGVCDQPFHKMSGKYKEALFSIGLRKGTHVLETAQVFLFCQAYKIKKLSFWPIKSSSVADTKSLVHMLCKVNYECCKGFQVF